MSIQYYDKSTDIESKIAFCTGRKKRPKWPTKENTGYTQLLLSLLLLYASASNRSWNISVQFSSKHLLHCPCHLIDTAGGWIWSESQIKGRQPPQTQTAKCHLVLKCSFCLFSPEGELDSHPTPWDDDSGLFVLYLVNPGKVVWHACNDTH